MRTMNHILFRTARLLFLWTVMLGTTVASAQNLTDSRSVSKSFPASRETTLEVKNKYGKIQVVTWEKDSVAVEVDIYLTESNTARLRKLKEDVKIDFTGTKTYVIAKTVIDSERGRIASEIKSISNTITGTNKKVEINYMIYLPVYMDVVLTNKFGDIYMDDLEGQLDINLSNGVLKANNLKGNSTISLSFANGMIKSLGSCTMELSYSDMVLNQVSQLDLESKSSRLHVDSVNVVKINSRRDKLYFTKVEYLYGKSSFSQVWVYDFLRESDVYMKYGKLTIEHIMPGFNKVYVESDYTDITLMFDKQTSFGFDILHHRKVVLRLPESKSLDEESFDGDDLYKTVGKVGPDGQGEPDGQVNIDALQKCFINLSYR